MDYAKIANIDLVKELGIDKMPEEKKEELLLEIGEGMQRRILLRIVEEVSEEKRDDFIKQLEENEKDAEKVEEILQEFVPNAEELITEEVGKYKSEMIEFMEMALKNDKQ